MSDLGESKKKTELFHGFFNNTMACVTLNYFLIFQKNVSFSWLKLGSGKLTQSLIGYGFP
jgi:hypothetical protein